MGLDAVVRAFAALPTALLTIVLLSACAPTYQPMGPALVQPRLGDDVIVTADVRRLPLEVWRPTDADPWAVVVAVHGYGDYANAFALPAPYWAEAGVITYAYDQRGFGRTDRPGIWPGQDTLIADLAATVRLIQARHPGEPVFVLGESMGGAVVLATLASDEGIAPDGAVLVAPAVWGRSTQPWYQRVALWVGARFLPWAEFSGEGLGILPSDNLEVLRALARDPLIQGAARTDSIEGLVDLMDRALASAASVPVPVLALYGEQDEVVPRVPFERMAEHLPADLSTVVYVPTGYHLLLRDLEAQRVWDLVLDWMRQTIDAAEAPSESLSTAVPVQ